MREDTCPVALVEDALNGISLKHRSRKPARLCARGVAPEGCPGPNLVEPKAGLAMPVSGADDGGPADTTQYPITR